MSDLYADYGVILFFLSVPDSEINLGHEPELQEGWARLQEKVRTINNHMYMYMCW